MFHKRQGGLREAAEVEEKHHAEGEQPVVIWTPCAERTTCGGGFPALFKGGSVRVLCLGCFCCLWEHRDFFEGEWYLFGKASSHIHLGGETYLWGVLWSSGSLWAFSRCMMGKGEKFHSFFFNLSQLLCSGTRYA